MAVVIITRDRESYRSVRHGICARSNSHGASHWTSPADPYLCSFNWTQNRIASIGCRWIATICIAGRSLLIYPPRGPYRRCNTKGSPLVDDRKDFPSLADAQCLSAYAGKHFSPFFFFLSDFSCLQSRWIIVVLSRLSNLSLSLFCNSIRLVLSEDLWDIFRGSLIRG